MDNNFQKDNNIDGKETKNSKYKITTYVLSFLVLSTVLFTASYFITDIILNVNKNEDSIQVGSETAVYNDTKALSNDVKILLMNDSVVEKEMTLGEFKKENDLAIDVSEAFIVNYYKNNGYEIDSFSNNKAIFKKTNQQVVLEPNKYYVGEEDGYFAIFKSDSKGELTLERKDNCPISILSNHPQDLEEIKNFKYCFDTKEEAEMQISQYTS